MSVPILALPEDAIPDAALPFLVPDASSGGGGSTYRQPGPFLSFERPTFERQSFAKHFKHRVTAVHECPAIRAEMSASVRMLEPLPPLTVPVVYRVPVVPPKPVPIPFSIALAFSEQVPIIKATNAAEYIDLTAILEAEEQLIYGLALAEAL